MEDKTAADTFIRRRSLSDKPRKKKKYITEADAKSIVSESSSYDEIVEKFEKLQKYPDYVGGSGTTLIEYWLDGDASSKIIINDTRKSIYIVTDENNGVYERLF